MSTQKIIALSLIFLGIGIVTTLAIIALINSNRPTAGLKVETTPPSTVFVDGKQIGLTPVDVHLRPGEVAVKLIPNSSTGSISSYETKVRLTNSVYTVIHREFGSSDSVSAGETISLLPQSGKLTSLAIISSSPDSASVTLDGQPQGFTPLL